MIIICVKFLFWILGNNVLILLVVWVDFFFNFLWWFLLELSNSKVWFVGVVFIIM